MKFTLKKYIFSKLNFFYNSLTLSLQITSEYKPRKEGRPVSSPDIKSIRNLNLSRNCNRDRFSDVRSLSGIMEG